MSIKVVDLFAGCGGFGEGFTSFAPDSQREFDVVLSVDNDKWACETLRLRKFFWQFEKAPDDYYQYLRGSISKAQLIERHPKQWAAADARVLNNELGDNLFTNEELPRLLKNLIGDEKHWVLIGGPPCQAYSSVGASRNRSMSQYVPEEDERHYLYRHYLKVIAEHTPSIFIMENVPGILSTKLSGAKIFPQILRDLEQPAKSLGFGEAHHNYQLRYQIFSLSQTNHSDLLGHSTNASSDYVIHADDYGVPQSRRRVVLVGVRANLNGAPPLLKRSSARHSVQDAIGDLPRIRSALSKDDDPYAWLSAIKEIPRSGWVASLKESSRQDLVKTIAAVCKRVRVPRAGIGGPFVRSTHVSPKILSDWLSDGRLQGACNHESRAHMASDLNRYFFAAAEMSLREKMARRGKLSKIKHVPIFDYPRELLPDHKNIKEASNIKKTAFSDRFKVQRAGAPSSTVLSHLRKDGHYFIHYDASQCRSLTVREAARLQTFPDNFYFEGPRGACYQQVGNAVPPLLSAQIAAVISSYLAVR